MSTPETTAQIDERIADRFQLKALVEACLVVGEGIAGVREHGSKFPGLLCEMYDHF